jgi:hypothetical protein
MKKRNVPFRKAKLSGPIDDFQLHKQQRNYVTDLIRRAKQDHVENLANKLCQNRNNKNWWKLAKTLCGRNLNESD